MNHYIVVSIEENGKYYSYVLKVSKSTNLLGALDIKGIKVAHLCKTKKEGEHLAKYWNECYKANGTYLFDEPQFQGLTNTPICAILYLEREVTYASTINTSHTRDIRL